MSLESEDFGYGFSDEFDSFDVDEFTSTHDDDVILGLVDDADLKFVQDERAALITDATDLEEDTTNYVSDTIEDYSVAAETFVPTAYKSKMEHARAIYAREQNIGTIIRKNIIKMFINEAACTPAGAATYYATINTK